MSVIKIGNRVVQSGDSGYQPRGVKTPGPKRRQLKTASEIPDNRQRYIANQAQKAENQRAQFLINQANRRSDVETAMRFAPELVNRSEFTGNKGDGLFGLNINATPTNIPKLREGLSSDEYANYMRGLYSINPSRMETMFPVASGAVIEKLLTPAPFKLLAQAMGDRGSDLLSGIKKIAQDKGIIPKDSLNIDTGTTANIDTADNIETVDSIFTGATPTDPRPAVAPGTSFDPSAGRNRIDDKIAQAYMDKAAMVPPRSGFDLRFTGDTPTDPGLVERALPTDEVTQGIKTLFTGDTPTNRDFLSTIQQPFNPPMIPGGLPRGTLPVREGRLLGADPIVPYGQELNLLDILADNLNTRGFNEGGLASINNPEYNLLMNASNFEL